MTSVTSQATDETHTQPVPSTPWVTIDAEAGSNLSAREWWQYRELLWFLIWRDVRVRYRQTLLGVAWALLQPLGVTLVFWLFVGAPANLPSDGVPYSLFALSGFIVWTFFANALAGSSQSLLANAHLITKVYFPRMLLPIAAVGARLVDFGIACVLLVAALLVAGVPTPTLSQVVLLPLLSLLLLLLALGAGIWLAALNVRHRDIGMLLPHLLQLGLFVTPIFYSTRMLPPLLQHIVAFNPLTVLLKAWRAALFGLAMDWRTLFTLTVFIFLLLWSALWGFVRREDDFADVV